MFLLEHAFRQRGRAVAHRRPDDESALDHELRLDSEPEKVFGDAFRVPAPSLRKRPLLDALSGSGDGLQN